MALPAPEEPWSPAGAMQIALDKVRSPPLRGTRASDEEEEVIGLTTGQAQSAKSRSCAVLLCCLLLPSVLLGALVGALVAHRNAPQMQRLSSMLPFGGSADVPLSFLVVGDWGRDGTHNQSQNAKAMGLVGAELQPDFIVSTGDNFYLTGLHNISDPQFTSSFTDVYTHPSLDTQWYSVLGNHDYITDAAIEIHPGLKTRDPRWHCQKNYRRTFSPCREVLGHKRELCPHSVELIFVDTSPLLSGYWDPQGHEPLNFTAMGTQEQARSNIIQLLTDALESSDATWRIVVGHHPVYSTGEHGSTSEVEQDFIQIFKDFHVDLYLNGHDHNLELIQVPGLNTLFVTSGAGSMTRTERLGEIPGSSLFYYELQGFASVSIAGPSLDLRFYDAFANVLYSKTIAKQ